MNGFTIRIEASDELLAVLNRLADALAASGRITQISQTESPITLNGTGAGDRLKSEPSSAEPPTCAKTQTDPSCLRAEPAPASRKGKRVYTPEGLAAMRENAAKMRGARLAKPVSAPPAPPAPVLCDQGIFRGAMVPERAAPEPSLVEDRRARLREEWAARESAKAAPAPTAPRDDVELVAWPVVEHYARCEGLICRDWSELGNVNRHRAKLGQKPYARKVLP